MNFIFFVIIGLLIFLSLLLGGRKYRSTALYALAIGGVVNANFFHAVNYPINCFGLPFGIDSIIYTLFIFCVTVMFIKENKKSAYLLAISSIIAILFSAVMQLISDLLAYGSSFAAWNTFLGFIISCFASIIAIVCMLEILNKLKGKVNNYLLLINGILIATVINSVIYYPLSILVSGLHENIGILLLTSFIGKAMSLIFSLITFFLINKIDNINKSN